MNRDTLRRAGIIIVPAGLLLAVLGQSPSVPLALAADDGGAGKIAKLEERVTSLEKVVLADPFHPHDTVLSRLDQIEKVLAERAKADEADRKGDQRSLGEIGKALAAVQKESDAIAGRVKALEEKKGIAGAAAGDDLKELRRDVDRAAKALEELRERVRRVEAKK